MLRKKDAYVLLILLGALLLVLVSLNVFGLGSVVGYVKDAGFLTAWVFAWILAVNTGSRALPREEETGTIFPLLAKPITRFELIAGKWLGAWSTAMAATLVFYLLVVAVTLAKGGTFLPGALIQAYLLHGGALSIIAAIAIAFSARMNWDAAASMTYVLTLAAFLVVPRVPAFLVYAKGISGTLLMVIYNLLPHFELFDMRKRIVHDYAAMEWHAFCFVILYGMLFTLVFLLAAWLGYRNKRFSRGDAYGV
jgi:ABC-type transport system involved in multi-copper enzyme maturation permease subunit